MFHIGYLGAVPYHPPSIIKIRNLNDSRTDKQNRCRGCISAKGKIRTQIVGYDTNILKVQKRYFVFHLIDDSNLEIAAIVFDNLVDKWYYTLEEGKMYTFSNFRVRLTHEAYRSYVLSNYQIVLGKSAEVSACQNIVKCSPTDFLQSNIPIRDLDQFYHGDTVDVLGVVLQMSEIMYRNTENAGLQPMRYIYLMDKTKCVIAFALWGWWAKEFRNKNNATIYLKAARVHEYNGGIELCHTADCIMKTYPDTEEANILWDWFHYEFNGKTRRWLSNI